MPSTSLLRWQKDRMPNLEAIDIQCAASLGAASPNPRLADENLRGYAVLLSAHFQGYCRDLYTEAAQIVASKVRKTLSVLVQAQFTAHLKLDRGNPSLENLRADFERFGFKLDLPGAHAANTLRLSHLSALNKWRNVAAHQGDLTATTELLTITLLRECRRSCAGLAISLDEILYNKLRSILKRQPWPS